MSEKKTIYDLKLHEVVEIKEYTVIRVPGGWIYSHYVLDKRWESALEAYEDIIVGEVSVFVPFNNEFKSGQQIGGLGR